MNINPPMNRDTLICSLNLSLARAAWWTAYANTPANLARMVQRGGADENYPYLMAHELVDNAMITANTHLTRAQEALEQLNTLSS